MNILKFGGSSVGTVRPLLNVKNIVESRGESVIVVVSALGGVTDLLLKASSQAASGDPGYRDTIAEISRRHNDMICELFGETAKAAVLKGMTGNFLSRLQTLCEGIFILGVLPEKTRCQIVSFGEQMSSRIVTELIDGASLYDSLDFIRTVKRDGKDVLDSKLTETLVKEAFAGFGGKSVAIVPGFISVDTASGDITNLGRGGSDYTASIIAAALDAECLEIWTDVDGFLTADPRVVKDAYVIDEISFTDAMELCNFGAKVIYPPALYPVCPKDIPILIKNTFRPEARGTVIRQKVNSGGRPVTGISSISDSCLITVSGPSMAGIVGVDGRIFTTLARRNISVFLVCQSSSETNISLGIKAEYAGLAAQLLDEEFSREITEGSMAPALVLRDLATVAIVSENMKGVRGLAGKLFSSLGANGISIIACAQGTEERNISFVIEKENLKKCLNVVHEKFFMEKSGSIRLYVAGCGTVGGALLEIIRRSSADIARRTGKRLIVAGVSNSRRYVVNPAGIDLAMLPSLLSAENSCSCDASDDGYFKAIEYLAQEGSVFVDCTANASVASKYEWLFKHGYSVVACNKIAFSAPLAEYSAMKAAAVKYGASLRYETTVGAALPILETAARCLNSGDRIDRIEAVLSGTLNYLFSNYQGSDFAGLVEKARVAGYTEPDPMIDLSGRDVLRKLLILSREAGVDIDEADVEKEEIPLDEAVLAGLWRKAADEGCRLRFVASLEREGEGYKARMGLRALPESHPFYNLNGTNNCALLTTEFYPSPLVVQGAGAGAFQTASGLLNDLLL